MLLLSMLISSVAIEKKNLASSNATDICITVNVVFEYSINFLVGGDG